MPTITFVTSGGKTAQVPDNSNLLHASLRWQGGIPFKCGGGKCGTCRCHIDSGREHLDDIKPKELVHLSDDELRDGYRMACQTFVRNGDVSVSWDPNRKPPFTRPARTPPATAPAPPDGSAAANPS